MSAAFEEEARGHQAAWKRWLYVLAAATILALVVGLIVISSLAPPDDATTAQVITALARDVLLIGLLLYVVRIASLQFRVHRHLDAVCRNKSAALKTFNRLVAGQEAEVRSVMASALAQEVFASGQTGFIGTGEDHVTLIERVASSVPTRGVGSG